MITMRNGTKYYRENELSKLGYIKKEELKDKINKIFKNNVVGVSNFIYPNNQYVKIISYDDSIREEILELIDKC